MDANGAQSKLGLHLRESRGVDELKKLSQQEWIGMAVAAMWGSLLGFVPAAGASYDPVADTWRNVNTSGEPTRGWNPAAVWTGTEMIVWGTDPDLTGRAYNPDTDSWRPMSKLGAPSLRRAETAVWSGNEMVIWGGPYMNVVTNDGGRYNPSDRLVDSDSGSEGSCCRNTDCARHK